MNERLSRLIDNWLLILALALALAAPLVYSEMPNRAPAAGGELHPRQDEQRQPNQVRY